MSGLGDSATVTMTVAEALRAGADYIEEHGWHNLAYPKRCENGGNTACAVTSLAMVCSKHPGWMSIQLDAVEALAEAVYLESSYKEFNFPGMIVGDWNDAQTSPDVVTSKMREVAASLEN